MERPYIVLRPRIVDAPVVQLSHTAFIPEPGAAPPYPPGALPCDALPQPLTQVIIQPLQV